MSTKPIPEQEPSTTPEPSLQEPSTKKVTDPSASLQEQEPSTEEE